MAENGSVHGQCTRPKTAVHTARTLPCTRANTATRTRPYTRHVTQPCTAVVFGRVDGPYTAVYTALVHVDMCTRPYTCRVHGRVHGPYMAVYTSRVRGRVRAMYPAEDVHADVFTVRVHGRHVTGTRHVTRPCTRPVRGRTTAVYTAVDGPYTDVLLPCRLPVHAVCMAV